MPDSSLLAQQAKPFLKWAGGKGKIISQLRSLYPKNLRQLEKYVEPFVGGGAVFLDMMQNYGMKSAYISDVNRDLILCYQVVKREPKLLCEVLAFYQKIFDATKREERHNLFLTVREDFNNQRVKIDYSGFSDQWILRAAQVIFLNKTCFNGLFRLNSKMEFNVPYGKYVNPTILDSDNIFAVSALLQDVEIRCANYNACFHEVTSNSFVYFDPPYKPTSKTANFTSYTGAAFTNQDQVDLANFYRRLDVEKRAYLMLSNSDLGCVGAEEDFFERLFGGYHFHRISVFRAIGCRGSKRGKVNELVITNY